MPTLKQAHLQFAQANRTIPKLQKGLIFQRSTKKPTKGGMPITSLGKSGSLVLLMKLFRRFEVCASYQHLWLKSSPSPSRKTLSTASFALFVTKYKPVLKNKNFERYY
jgi:hypothetical protein